MLASQSSDEADDIQCEAADLDVDLEGMEQLNEDSLLADESTEENTGMGTTTDEEDILYDPAEVTGGDEDEEKEALTAAQPQVGGMGHVIDRGKVGRRPSFFLPSVAISSFSTYP